MSAKTWQRKIRKLCRDPKRFARDMRLLRTFPIARTPAVRGAATVEAFPPEPAAEGRPFEPMEAAELLWRDDQLACRIVERRVAEFRLSSLVFLRRTDPLLVNEPHAQDLLRDPGFVGFRPNYLHFGAYETTPEAVQDDALIIYQIPPPQRLLLARHQNLIFVDPACRLPYALRSVSATSRLFVVLTRQADPAFELRPEEVDVLLVEAGHPDALRQGLRRKIVFDGRDEMLGALKRAIIEASSRPHNVLLPVMNGLRFQPDLLGVDTSDVDGILVCGARDGGTPGHPEPATFGSWLGAFCGGISEIYLAEETLLRYRTLCEEAESDPGRWARLLALSLKDGARYDVRT